MIARMICAKHFTVTIFILLDIVHYNPCNGEETNKQKVSPLSTKKDTQVSSSQGDNSGSNFHEVSAILGLSAVRDVSFIYPNPHQAVQEAFYLSSKDFYASHSLVYSAEEVHRFKPENLIYNLLQNNERSVDKNLSKTCEAQLNFLLHNLTLSSPNPDDLWAAQMLDSWGRPEAGLLTGVLNWLGDYEECTGAKSASNDSQTSYQGKYCTGMHPSTQLYKGQNMTMTYQMGMCVPSGCTDRDAALFYDMFLGIVKASSLTELPSVTCQPVDKPLHSASIATYVVYCFVFVLCLLSGLYDYSIHGTYMYYKAHGLPVPVELQPAYQQRLGRSEDEGNLIPEDIEDMQPRRHKCMSGYEVCAVLIKKSFLSFSWYTNGYKQLTPSQPEGAIHCIHGIRFLSLSWVILGHSLVFSLSNIMTPSVIMEWIQRFTFMGILNATYAVDSFFLISAILATYLMLRRFTRQNVSKVTDVLKMAPVLYLHRYIRLTPALGFMVLFYMYGLYNLCDGPMCFTSVVFDSNCNNKSWATLLYVNNLFDPDNECVPWSWYLSNDFQFFLVTPFIVGIIYWSGKVGMAVTGTLVLISCASAMGIVARDNLGLSLVGGNVIGGGGQGGLDTFLNGLWFGDFYVKPWVRFQAYGVGMIYGYIIWKTGGKLRIHKWLNILLWFVSFALIGLPVYGAYDGQTGGHTPSLAENVLYNGLTRTSWSVGLGYIVLACHSGQGGWVNELLSWRGFIPVSRLTYCAYLLHPAVMSVINFTAHNLTYYTNSVIIGTYLQYMVASYSLAFIFSLMFEMPMMNIDRDFITGLLHGRPDPGKQSRVN